jgi:hypothetical protein
VATNGMDANAGTLALPWRTIQHAANTLAPGDTVLVRGGVYNEAVTSTSPAARPADNPVTFQNYPGETPIVDGTGLAVPAAQYAAGLFEFTNASYIVVQGFEIRNYQTSEHAKSRMCRRALTSPARRTISRSSPIACTTSPI